MGKIFIVLALFAKTVFGGQVGSQFQKIDYKRIYKQHSQQLDSLIENTVLINVNTLNSKVTRGTGFYIGKHKGNHIFITNHHVMSKSQCDKAIISFINKSGTTTKADCDQILLAHSSAEHSDITIFTIPEKQLAGFVGKGLTIDWNFKLESKVKLAIAGFGAKLSRVGRVDNQRILRSFRMRLNYDSDCVTLNAKIYYMTPFNVGDTFIIGCDAIGGDSGSAVIERSTGKVVGLLWGASDKGTVSSKVLWKELIGTSDPRLFSNSSRAILLKRLKPELESIGVQGIQSKEASFEAPLIENKINLLLE